MRRPRLPTLLVAALVAASCGETDRAGTASRGEGVGPGGGGTLADSVLGAWIGASGGTEAWDRVRGGRYTVTTVWYDTAGEVSRMRPRRVELRRTERGFQSRIERPEAEGLYVQAFDGDTAWATLNGRPLPPDHPAAEEAEYVGRDVFYWIGLPYKLRDPGVRTEAERVEPGEAPTIARAGGIELRISFGDGVGQHPGDRYFYYFLDEDPYPEEVHYVEQGAESRNRTQWSGFRSQAPITYVGTRRYVDGDGRTTVELRIDDVQVNPDLPDSVFAPPSAPEEGG